ncbi:MAG: carboxypeptidase regulatory-like domain-containing protein [Candidatus Anammoxibacter sp.]
MKLVKGIGVIAAVFCLVMVSVSFNVNAAVAEFSGKVKSVDTVAKTITITTDAGEDKTFTTDDKTKVTIIDVDGAKTKADAGSILSVAKDGADKADSVVIKADDAKMLAKKITATTTRRMTLTKEEIKKRTAILIAGNIDIADQVKLKTDASGTIKGSVRVMARTSADTIIYIQEINGNNFTPVAKQLVPEGAENVKVKVAGSAAEYPMMDQVNIAFTPHVLPVLKGSVVDFPNSDTVRHNVFGPDPIPGTDEKINLGTYDVGTIKTVNLYNTGELSLLCNVHAEMSGFIVAIGNPYFTLTDRKGAFTIENVPAGTYKLTTWHERFKPVIGEVTVVAGETAEVKLPTMKQKR